MSAEQQPPLSQDPDVLAEEKKTKIWHIRMERYTEVAKTVATILQTFKAEAVSLVSGTGTLVIGWFQVRKYVLQGRNEVKALKAEVQAVPVAKHRKGTQEHVAVKSSALVEGVMGVPETGVVLERNNGFSDPMNYFPVVTMAVFIGSLVAVWRKRKNKATEGGS